MKRAVKTNTVHLAAQMWLPLNQGLEDLLSLCSMNLIQAIMVDMF
jgi:hypothetical protein